MTQLKLRIRLTAPQGSITKNTIPVNINPNTQECPTIFFFFFYCMVNYQNAIFLAKQQE